jgi:hypothetical protein
MADFSITEIIIVLVLYLKLFSLYFADINEKDLHMNY